MSEIGESFDDKVFTQEEYSRVEDAYVEAILLFMQEQQIEKLQLIEYENHQNYQTDKLLLENKTFYNKEQVSSLIRLILREEIWGKLVYEKEMFVHFGYDYYMYVGLQEESKQALDFIPDLGLFVEKYTSPYI